MAYYWCNLLNAVILIDQKIPKSNKSVSIQQLFILQSLAYYEWYIDEKIQFERILKAVLIKIPISEMILLYRSKLSDIILTTVKFCSKPKSDINL